METAKLLMNGDTQAVVLPKEFHFQVAKFISKK
jgi:virulence-associated protein VagC